LIEILEPTMRMGWRHHENDCAVVWPPCIGVAVVLDSYFFEIAKTSIYGLLRGFLLGAKVPFQ
jgi:hypothetical protein